MQTALEVELPLEVALELMAGEPSSPAPTALNRQDAFADIAEYAATFGAEAACLVTLLQTPSTIRDLAVLFAKRRRERGSGYWLSVRGPGGQANVELVQSLDPAALESLLRAIWDVPDELDD